MSDTAPPANPGLDAFLAAGAPPAPAAPPAGADPPAADAGKTPPAGATPSATPPAAKTPAAGAPPPDPADDADPGEPEPGQPVVPRQAYESERTKRQNWVARASAAEAERDELRRQLEQAKRPPPPPPSATPPAPAAPRAPPTVEQVLLNERLNNSEMMAVEKHGQTKIDEEIAYFKERAGADPRLWPDLYSKPHPYQWMIEANATARLHAEIGSDPVAYEAKIRAKIAGETAAGGAGGAPPAPVSPAAGLPPSLATARSAAPRTDAGFAGPPSLADILRRPDRRR